MLGQTPSASLFQFVLQLGCKIAGQFPIPVSCVALIICEALLGYFLTTHVTSLNPSVMLVPLKARQKPPEANGDSATKNSASIHRKKFLKHMHGFSLFSILKKNHECFLGKTINVY